MWTSFICRDSKNISVIQSNNENLIFFKRSLSKHIFPFVLQGGEQIYSALDMWRNAAATFTNDQESQNHSIVAPSSVQNEELYHVDDVLAMIDNEQSGTPHHYGVPVGPNDPQSPHNPMGGNLQPSIVPPPEYSTVIKNRPPPSFEDHMRATGGSTSSLSTRMPSIDELLQQQEPVGNPPPPYPGTSNLITLQPPMSQTSSNHDMTEGKLI